MNEITKNRIVEANRLYREGTPIITDAEYDDMLGNLGSQIDPVDFQIFIKTLTEPKGESTLRYVIGSLDKIKFEETERLNKFINKQKILHLFTSLKIDGCSFVASYKDGELTGCWSRGDGQEGVDWTDKARHILPTQISNCGQLDIRGEFSLTEDSHTLLGFKNRRNGTVGIMNSKEVSIDKLKHVKSFVYQILNNNTSITEQFDIIRQIGFSCPVYHIFLYARGTPDIANQLRGFYEKHKISSIYDIDGLVISSVGWMNENVFYPEGKVAFKINSGGIGTVIKGVEWVLSKTRYLKPVLLVEPIEIGGTTVSRVTGYNAKYVMSNGLGIGAQITVVKSGEIIPMVCEIITPVDVTLPEVCPECGLYLGMSGVELQCPNKECGEVKRIVSFIKSLGIENVSEKRLVEWGIIDFESLQKFQPSLNYKSQMDFYNQLIEKMFHKSPSTIMRSFSFNGFGSTLFDLLLTYCGSLDNMNTIFRSTRISDGTLPVGIGERTIEKASHDWKTNWQLLQNIMMDTRYIRPNENSKPTEKSNMTKLTGKSILITGTLTKPRKEFEFAILESGGITASGVSKNLDYLLVGEKAGSKLDKAKKIPSITILTEDDFWKLVG